MMGYSDEQKKIVVTQFLSYVKKITIRMYGCLLKKDERRKSAERIYSRNRLISGISSELNSAGNNGVYIDFELYNLLGMLTKKQRYIITYNIIYGYSENELAEYMNISQQSVGKLKERGLDSIRKMMEVSL